MSRGGKKQLWLLVGGNGAGKSTFYRLFLEPRGIPFLNADRIARLLDPAAPENVSYEAAGVAERLRQQLLKKGVTFCFESVFSHQSKLNFAAEAKRRGYELIVVFIHLDDPELNLARIAQRIEEGGHGVPASKVRARLPRTLENMTRLLALADEAHLLDNSSWDDPFRRVAIIRQHQVTIAEGSTPDWALELLTRFLTKEQ